MMMPMILCAVLAVGPGESDHIEPDHVDSADRTVAVRSVAMRVHHMEAMLSFYGEAFGIEFKPLELPHFTMYEGSLGEVVFKFVPIRDAADFDEFPIHQLGFTVPDLEEVIRLVEKHGGRLIERRPGEGKSPPVAAVRDPDGNSIELFE